MRFFGPKPWGIALDEPEMMLHETPVGWTCSYCDELIAEGESGVVLPHLEESGWTAMAQHRECYLRHVFGSVGHQRQLCSCYGGTDEDPPGLTKREAARASCEIAMAALSWRRDG